jgi:hypothetical protein
VIAIEGEYPLIVCESLNKYYMIGQCQDESSQSHNQIIQIIDIYTSMEDREEPKQEPKYIFFMSFWGRPAESVDIYPNLFLARRTMDWNWTNERSEASSIAL